MTIQYIPLPTATAEKLSRELYHLSQPVAIRNPANVTTHYCGWHVKKTDATQSVLAVPDDADGLPVNAQALLAEIQTIYADAVTKLDATKVETDLLEAKIVDAKTQAKRLDPHDALILKWKLEALTKKGAEDLGYLPVVAIV